VRFLILNKSGTDVSFVTFTPFGGNRIMTVPLRNVSAVESRSTANTYLPMRVKNKNFYYILDMKGEFQNTRIFDYTIALKRKL